MIFQRKISDFLRRLYPNCRHSIAKYTLRSTTKLSRLVTEVIKQYLKNMVCVIKSEIEIPLFTMTLPYICGDVQIHHSVGYRVHPARTHVRTGWSLSTRIEYSSGPIFWPAWVTSSRELCTWPRLSRPGCIGGATAEWPGPQVVPAGYPWWDITPGVSLIIAASSELPYQILVVKCSPLGTLPLG